MSVIPYLGHLLHCQHLLTLGIYGKKNTSFQCQQILTLSIYYDEKLK